MKDTSPLHEFVSARVVYENAYFVVRAEGDCVLVERTDRAFETPSVVLETNQSMSPAAIRPIGDENYVHVIMPMHLG